MALFNNPPVLQLNALVIEDNSYTAPAVGTGSFVDIQSSLSKNSATAEAVAEFLKLTRSRFGYGPAAGLMVEFLNLAEDET